MNTRIVEAVGFARKPGHHGTIRSNIWWALMRAFAWLLHRAGAAPNRRHRALLYALSFRTRFLRLPFLAGASIGNTTENDILKLYLNATAISLIADNTGTTPLTNIFVSLHTGDPGEGGTQNTSEISYTGYARILVARTTGGWTAASSGSSSPVANIDFGQMTAGAGGTVTHFAIGSLTSGAGVIYWSGTVTPNISVVNGVIPRLTTASTITLD